MFGILKENFIKVYKTSEIEKIYKEKNENNQIINFEDEIYTYQLKNNHFFQNLFVFTINLVLKWEVD